MLVTTSPDSTWTNWPKAGGGLYVAFILESLKGLLPGRIEGLNRTVGEPLVYHPAAADHVKPGDDARLLTPTGQTIQLPPVQTVQGQVAATVPETRLIGIYRIAVGPHPTDDKAPGATFAVALEPMPGDATRLRESEDLEGLDSASIDNLLGVKVKHIDAAVDAGSFVTAERFSKDWSFWLLAVVLGMVLIEAGLAWFCGKPLAT
jgi:hypothetical protein